MTLLQIKLQMQWLINGYSQDLIDKVFICMDAFANDEWYEGEIWVTLPDINFLQCVSWLTHDSLKYCFQDNIALANLTRDVVDGVEFCFGERRGLLEWER